MKHAMIDESTGSEYCLVELDRLRLQVSHLTLELAMQHARRLEEIHRELVRETLLRYVIPEELDRYVIELSSGVVRQRQEL